MNVRYVKNKKNKMCAARVRTHLCAYALCVMLLLVLMNTASVSGNGAAELQLQQSHDKVLSNLQQNLPLHATAEHMLHQQQQQQQQQQLPIKPASNLQFQPAELEFGATLLGSTRSLQVTLINTDVEQSVQLLSTLSSDDNPTFYANLAGVSVKLIPPRRNITFDIGFLPWKEGLSKTNLIFQTNRGQVSLTVRGIGTENPYRLKPLLELKAPLNATLAPEIHMYNPHDRPLQIMEVYSSGGKFQLELPSGGSEGPQTLWQIPPFTQKPIIRIRFHGATAGNYTAYIRVKLAELSVDSLLASNEHIFVIPIEFEIMPNYGLYASNPLIDFGRITADQHAEQVYFHLPLHSSHRQRGFKLLNNVADDLLQYDFKEQRLVLQPAACNRTTTIDRMLLFVAATTGQLDEQATFSVIVRGEVFKGKLAYDSNHTIFVQPPRNAKANEPRLLCVQNKFDVPMAIRNISLQQSNSSMLELSVLKELDKLVLLPDMRVNLLQLKARTISHNYQSIVRIYTNITLFEIPVIVCSGRLHVTTQNNKRFHLDEPYNTELNLGAIPLAELSHEAYVLLRNPNSIVVKLKNWDFQSTEGIYFHTTFLGCFNATQSSNATSMTTQLDQVKFNFCASVGLGEVGVFKVAIQPQVTEHQYATLKIWTPYELITITIKFFTWLGSLEIEQDRLQFSNCFPGKLCTTELSIRSSFEQPLHLVTLNFAEPYFSYARSKPKDIVIAPRSSTHVGSIRFEPSKLCGSSCYIAWNATRDAFDDMHFVATDAVLDFDMSELRSRVERYRQLKWLHKSATVTLHSREIQKFDMQFALDMEWPKLVKSKPSSPVVEVGNATNIHVDIINPADVPLLLDYFLSNPQLAKQTKFSLPPEVVEPASSCYLTDEFVFHLVQGAPSVPVLVPAGKRLRVTIMFSSPFSGTYCTLLHIRNNLTMYEAVWISGKAVHSQFRFGNRKPGSRHPLLFEVTAAHLTQCTPDTQLLVRRSFMARNLGDVPIKVSAFQIDAAACTGHGFSVQDCAEFVLPTNASKKLELVFKPDLTSRRFERTLTLHTNLSYPVQYQLVGWLAREQLLHCAAQLPRPRWEQRMRIVAIIVLLVMLMLVVLAAHIDYSQLLVQQSTLFYKRDQAVMQPTFNLRHIAVKSQLEADEQQASEKRKQNAQKTTAKYNSSGTNFLRKRDTKRYFANGQPITFSERQFKLKQEAERAKAESDLREADAKPATRPTKATTNKPSERDESAKEREVNAKLAAKRQQPAKLTKKSKATATTNQKDMKPKTADDQSDEHSSERADSESVRSVPAAELTAESPTNSQHEAEYTTPQEEYSAAEAPVQQGCAAEATKSRHNPFEAAANAHFASEMNNTPLHCITSPWDTSSHVTFSEIFPSKVNAMHANAMAEGLHYAGNNLDSAQSDCQRRNMDLGPIGSRRSPTLATANAAAPVQSSLFAEFLNAAHYRQEPPPEQPTTDWRTRAAQKLSYMPAQEERHKLLEPLERSPINSAKQMRRALGQLIGNWQLNDEAQQEEHAQLQQPSHAQTMPTAQRHALLDPSDSCYAVPYNWHYQNNNMESNWSPFTNVPAANYTAPLSAGNSWLAGNSLRPPPGLGYAAATAAYNNTPQTEQIGANARAHEHLLNNFNNMELDSNNANANANTNANGNANDAHASLWQNHFNNKH